MHVKNTIYFSRSAGFFNIYFIFAIYQSSLPAGVKIYCIFAINEPNFHGRLEIYGMFAIQCGYRIRYCPSTAFAEAPLERSASRLRANQSAYLLIVCGELAKKTG